MADEGLTDECALGQIPDPYCPIIAARNRKVPVADTVATEASLELQLGQVVRDESRGVYGVSR